MIQFVIASDFCPDWSYILRCPKCGDDYLHHGTVVIYGRAEDQPTTVAVSDISDPTIIGRENPSPRRDAVGIVMDCEGCGPVGELCILQHKGQTFLEWRS